MEGIFGAIQELIRQATVLVGLCEFMFAVGDDG